MIFANKKFINRIATIEAFDAESFKEVFAKIEQYRHSAYLCGYIRYEAKDVFLGRKVVSDLPLLYFEVFEGYEDFVAESFAPAVISTTPEMSFEEYSCALRDVKNQIAHGNTYQVNYTYNHKVSADCEGFALYQAVLASQMTPYNAYIKNDYEEILSFSPELFFEIKDGVIKTKPMKGTIKRGATDEEDAKRKEFLRSDDKNRAENVMIVDLLRNDLSIVAKTGTVRVDRLFEIETHKTLHQMTSEVSAEVKEDVTLYEIFEALFPCGSVTGAPKISTMEIIEALEQGKRDIYCGAIGVISPDSAVFSVPIRILQKENTATHYRCRVGGGIVWDSDCCEEWQETLTKIGFLGGNIRHSACPRYAGKLVLESQAFQIVETLRAQGGEFEYGAEHFARMQKSAQELGFKFNDELLSLSPEKDGMVRVLLSYDGNYEVQYLPLREVVTDRVTISEYRVDSSEKFLYHKTTHRPWYADAMAKVKAGMVFDEIFFNERSELTEGARSNILLEKDGVLYTPPVSCGLLGGVLRQKMLSEGQIVEKVLYLEDLRAADAVFCINSVRGVMKVEAKFT